MSLPEELSILEKPTNPPTVIVWGVDAEPAQEEKLERLAVAVTVGLSQVLFLAIWTKELLDALVKISNLLSPSKSQSTTWYGVLNE